MCVGNVDAGTNKTFPKLFTFFLPGFEVAHCSPYERLASIEHKETMGAVQGLVDVQLEGGVWGVWSVVEGVWWDVCVCGGVWLAGWDWWGTH